MPHLTRSFKQFAYLSCAAQLLAAPVAVGLAGLLYAGPGQAQTTAAPTSDPLRGERRLLPFDDLLVFNAQGPGNALGDPFLDIFLTFENGILQRDQAKQVGGSGSTFGLTAGRMFAAPRDTIVNTHGGQASIYLGKTDPAWSGSLPHAVQTAWIEGGGLARPLIAMDDFSGDGYEELVIGSADKGLQVATAVDVTDPTKGLRWGEFLSPVNTLSGSALATGDFDGDGDPEVALAYPWATTSFRLEIYEVDPTELWLQFQHSVTVESSSFGQGSFPIRKVSITAGDFDNDVSDVGLPDEELVVTASQVAKDDRRFIIQTFKVFSTLQPVAETGEIYTADFDPSCTSCGGYASTIVESDRLDWTGALEQAVVGLRILGTDGNPWSQLWILTFGGSDDLSFDAVLKHPLDRNVYKDICYSGIRGLAIGNFDRTILPPDTGPSIPASLDIAVVQGYTIGDEVGYGSCNLPLNMPQWPVETYSVDPSNSFAVAQVDQVLGDPIDTGHRQYFTLAAGDFQGGSLWVGAPEIVPLKDLGQLEVAIQAPPMHMDFIQPVDETGENLLNLSFGLPGFNTTFTDSSSTTKAASHQSTTSHSFAEKESLEDSMSFGIPDVASVSVDIKTSSEQTQKQVVSKSSTTINTTLNSMLSASDLDDRLWYTQHDVDLYIYPVLCPPDPKNPEECGTTPSHVMFSVPQSQKAYSFVPGASVEWYQPPHQVAQALSYPWTKAQLEALFPSATLDTKLEVQNLPAAGPLNTTFQWTGVGETTDSIGKTHTLSFNTSISISSDVNGAIDIFEAGGKTKESFSFSHSSSTSTLNTTESKVTGKIGFATNVPAASDLRSGSNPDYAYDFDVMVFGQKHPPCTTASSDDQEAPSDEDEASKSPTCIFDDRTLTETVTTQGTLWAGYTIDLSDGGNWWTSPETDYFTRHDVALGHPQRWVRDPSQSTGDNCLLDSSSSAELCYEKSPDSLQPDDIWTSDFYRMKGFFVLPTVKNADGKFLVPQGPQTAVINADGHVWLQARIHNYSFVATRKSGNGANADNTVHVRFYAQEWDHVNNVPSAGKQSILVDEVVLDNQCIPGHSNHSISKAACPNGGTNNWLLATTSQPFDPVSAGIDVGSDGTYVLFWVVAWIEDANGALVPEVAEHGLTGLPGTLTSLTGASRLAETYSNNIGFFPLPTFVCPSGIDCSNVSVSAEQNASATNGPAGAPSASGGELLREAAVSEAAESVPEVHIEEVSLPKRAVPLHQPFEVHALLSAGDVSPQGVHVALYDGYPEAGGQIFDVELVPYLRANDTYLVRAKYRPETCGPHDIFVVADLGSGLEPAVGAATVNVSMDPTSDLGALQDLVRSAKLPKSVRKSVRAGVRAAKHAFRRGKAWDGLQHIDDLRGHAWKLGAKAPASVADAIRARIETITECVSAAHGEVAGSRQRPRYRWPF